MVVREKQTKKALSNDMAQTFICFNENSLKMIKNVLFHLKSSFRSQDISSFVLTFWSFRKSGLNRNARLISKFLTSQSGQQTSQPGQQTKNRLSNISRSKGNQAMKFEQVIEDNKRNIFLKKSCRKWTRETSSRPFFFFFFNFKWGKSKWSTA